MSGLSAHRGPKDRPRCALTRCRAGRLGVAASTCLQVAATEPPTPALQVSDAQSSNCDVVSEVRRRLLSTRRGRHLSADEAVVARRSAPQVGPLRCPRRRLESS